MKRSAPAIRTQDDPPRLNERPHRLRDLRADGASGEIPGIEIAERQQHVVDAVAISRVEFRIETLQLALDLFHGVAVQQLAQFGIADELTQLRLVHGERLRPAFGEGRVAVVEKARDVAEEQRGRKRRRLIGIDGGDADGAAADVGERRDERRHVEEIAQTLAIGLEQHRKRAVTRRHRQQIGGTFPLLPERCAHPGPAFGQEQRARRILAKLGREQRRRAELPHHQRLDLVGIGQHQPRIGRLVDIRKPHHEPVVSPHRLDVDAGLLPDLGHCRHRPRRVDAAAPRREDADAPVAQLVAHAFDDDGGGVGDGAGGGRLIAEILKQVLGGAGIEVVVAGERVNRRGRWQADEVVHQPADCQSQFERPAGPVAFPERHLPRFPGGG